MPYTRFAMVDAMPPATVSRHPTPAAAGARLPGLDAGAARRTLVHLLAASPEAFGGSAPPLATLTDSARLDEDGLGCDSLARLDLATRVAELFDLARLGREDLLLTRRSVGAWAALAAEGWGGDGPRRVVFRTSGSTGAPAAHAHAAADLGRETAALAERLGAEGPIRRVLALVRPHHVYGFLLTVALPARLGVPVVDLAGRPDGAEAAAARLAARLAADGPGTLVVAAPPHWRYLAAVLPDRPTGAVGVCSTGPLDPAVANRLGAGPLQALVEIFGSTETGGLGTRRHPEAAFTLFDHWARDPADPDRLHRAPAGADGVGARVALPDRLDWLDARRFRPAGRRDRQVSIGGVQVSPDAVARRLTGCPGVAAARVRPHGPAHALRLKALVVPRDGTDAARLRADLAAFVRSTLPAAERPVDLAIAPAVPVDATGKETDWPVGDREGGP